MWVMDLVGDLVNTSHYRTIFFSNGPNQCSVIGNLRKDTGNGGDTLFVGSAEKCREYINLIRTQLKNGVIQ